MLRWFAIRATSVVASVGTGRGSPTRAASLRFGFGARATAAEAFRVHMRRAEEQSSESSRSARRMPEANSAGKFRTFSVRPAGHGTRVTLSCLLRLSAKKNSLFSIGMRLHLMNVVEAFTSKAALQLAFGACCSPLPMLGLAHLLKCAHFQPLMAYLFGCTCSCI